LPPINADEHGFQDLSAFIRVYQWLPCLGEGSLHFGFCGKFAGIHLPQTFAYLVHLRAVNVEIGVDRLINDVVPA